MNITQKRIYHYIFPKGLSFLIGLLGLLFTNVSNAQIPAPDFYCVQSDTLFWNPVTTIDCGGFQNYTIFASTDPNGTFTELTVINDQQTTSYFDANTFGNQYFYYLITNADCSNALPISSDTLDNRPPSITSLEAASVVNGQVELTWTENTDPDVVGYIVYRQTDIGTIPIDTVMGTNQYIDASAQPNDQPELYFVNAIDPCGNTSLFDQDAPHQTMLLSTEVDPCRQSVTLTWNRYITWQSGVEAYEILLSIDGGAEQQVGEVGGDETTFVYENANDQQEYCFTVRARDGLGFSARSSQSCQLLDIVQPNRNFAVTNVTWTDADDLEVSFVWDEIAELQTGALFRSGSNDNYQSETSLASFIGSSGGTVTVDPSGGDGPFYFIAQSTDDCDSLATSTYASSVLLNIVTAAGNINQLSWTPLDVVNAQATSFVVYRETGGTVTEINSGTGGSTNFNDPIDPGDPNLAQACYYVEITYELTLPDGTNQTFTTRSNTVCAEQRVLIFAPNAIAPAGTNRLFRPVLLFAENAQYYMAIYNRYGGRVFETDDLEVGWEGRQNGNIMPAGAYVYYIRVTQNDGTVVEDEGTVVLIK